MMSAASEIVRSLIFGLKKDLSLYKRLTLLLVEQASNLSQRDNGALFECNKTQLDLVAELQAGAALRSRHMQLLGFPENLEGVKELAQRLPVSVKEGLLALCTSMESEIACCKQLNESNGRLLASQQIIISHLLQGQRHFYNAP
ncbi:MAG: flagellar export chaperone FlgN [Plesiomonas sp.]